jgi:hypothetical protein
MHASREWAVRCRRERQLERGEYVQCLARTGYLGKTLGGKGACGCTRAWVWARRRGACGGRGGGVGRERCLAIWRARWELAGVGANAVGSSEKGKKGGLKIRGGPYGAGVKWEAGGGGRGKRRGEEQAKKNGWDGGGIGLRRTY